MTTTQHSNIGESMEWLIEKGVMYLATQFPVVSALLMFLGTLPVIISVIVKITPWKSDDVWFEALQEKPWYAVFKFLGKWSLVQRKTIKK